MAATSAGAPEVITIAIDVDTSTETFSRPQSSLLCPSGPAVGTYDHFGNNSVQAATFHVTKLINCGNGDTLTIQVDVAANPVHGTTTGGWSIVAGTGAFDGYKGAGHVVGTPGSGDPIDLIDHYYGTTHP